MNKLSIVLAARSRPELLVETLKRTLPNMAMPDTRILVALDDDDPENIRAAQDFAAPEPRVYLSVKPREDSLGEKFNRVLTEAPADVYLAMVDYAPHITPAFDQLIMEAASVFPDKIGVVFNAQSVESSVFSAINAVTHRLTELMGGFYPGHYPYWFVDHHLHDVAHMIDRIAYADVELDVSRRPGTMDLREPIWWATFCDQLMPERQAMACKIIAAMDDPPWRKDLLVRAFPHHAHTSWFVNECMRKHPWDRIRHDTDTTDARYQRIKRRAIEAAPQMAAIGDWHKGEHMIKLELTEVLYGNLRNLVTAGAKNPQTGEDAIVAAAQLLQIMAQARADASQSKPNGHSVPATIEQHAA